MSEFDLILSATEPLQSGGYPGLKRETITTDKFRREKDVPVELSDGTTIYIDIFLPLEAEPVPAILCWSPYGKHGVKNLGMMPGADVDPNWISSHTIWEGADPEFWCPRGYAIVSPDPRGAWASEGTLTFYDKEKRDGYEVIEWLARQPWCTGSVGMLGVSYLAVSQWLIAAEQPPSLKAIIPWEGLSDPYRELFFTGGIPEVGFLHWWQKYSRYSLSPAEDILQLCAEHDLLDSYWEWKMPKLEQVMVPTYAVVGWAAHNMHTRGTLEAFRRISSEHKWLDIHGQKKWRYFHHPDSVARQQAFFDQFLKDQDCGVMEWPRVTYECRQNNQISVTKTAAGYPIPGASPLRLHLDASNASLRMEPPTEQAEASYHADPERGRTTFTYRFAQDAEITGGARLHIWMSADEHDEMDVFVMLRKRDRDGEPVGFRWWAMFDNGPIALGWLRASHRELSPDSTEFQPIHPHRSLEPVTPGEPLELDIEILPSSTQFLAGEMIEVTIGGADLSIFEGVTSQPVHAPNNKGQYSIHTGPGFDSYLVLPVISD